MIKPPSDQPPNPRRVPAAFAYEDNAQPLRTETKGPVRKPASFGDQIVLTAAEDDPFLNPEKDAPPLPVAVPRKRGTSFGKIALGAFGVLFSLAFGLWTDSLIRNLFTRADWLGYAALAALAIGILAVIAIVVRETAGMMRLAAVQTIKAQAEKAILETKSAKARALVKSLDHPARRQGRDSQGPRHAEGSRRRHHRRPASHRAGRARAAGTTGSAGARPDRQRLQTRLSRHRRQPACHRRPALRPL
jgi:putative membrane protein